MRVAILPSGALLAEPEPDDDASADGLSPVARARVVKAFARGAGHALLDLGATEVDTALSPPLAFLRDIGRAFVTRLRAVPDLEDQRERVQLDCPPDERARLAAAVPPMDGGEHVGADWIGQRWEDLRQAFAEAMRAHRGTVADWLRARHPSWHTVGKVCLHLAENRGDDEHPFAFLATYAVRAGAGGTIQHRPLSRAVEESSARRDRQALLSLLVPLQRAAEQTPWLAELVDSGAVYEAMAWTPAEAHRFLHSIPAFEAAGLVVRIPDWWRPRRPPRPEVSVRVGDKKPAGVGMDALLDFSVAVALGGERLTAAEVRQLLASAGGLVRLRGQWVELDRERLREVLDHWERVRRDAEDGGLSFLEGMRLLAGAARMDGEAAALAATEGWSRVEAGAWLARTLEGLRGPDGARRRRSRGPTCAARCGPYQKVGVSWLAFASSLRLGVCLADDMGLGKTIQVLALLLLRKRRARAASHRTCSWRRRRCSPTGRRRSSASRRRLRRLVAHPSAMPAAELAELGGADLARHRPRHHHLRHAGARARRCGRGEWSLVILDEAQAIKNPGARQTRAVKALQGARAHRADGHAGREPPRRPVVDLRLPRPRPAGLARASSPRSSSAGGQAGRAATRRCAGWSSPTSCAG